MNTTLNTWITRHKIQISIIAFLILILILLPVAIKQVAISQLKNQGAEDVYISDVDLNLFAGKIGIEEFKIKHKDEEKIVLNDLQLNIAMLSLLKKRIEIESLEIDGLHVDIEQSPDLLFIGFPIPLKKEGDKKPEEIPPVDTKTEEETKSTIDFGIQHFRLANSSIKYTAPQLASVLAIHRIEVKNLLSWKPDKSAYIKVDSSVNKSPFSAEVDLRAFSQQKFAKAQISLKKFSFLPFAKLAEKSIKDLNGQLDVDTEITLQLDDNGEISLTQNGRVGVNDVRGISAAGAAGNVTLNDLDVSWQGEINAKTTPDNKLSRLDIVGEFKNEHLSTNFKDLDISLAHSGITYKGSVKSSSVKITDTLKTKGQIILDKLIFESQKQGLKILSLEKLDINTLEMNGLNDIAISSLALQNIEIANPDKEKFKTVSDSLMKNKDLKVTGIQVLKQSDIIIDAIAINGLGISIFRDEKQKLPLINTLADLGQSLQKKIAGESGDQPETKGQEPSGDAVLATATKNLDPEKKPANKQSTIKINSILMSSENSIKILDVSVSPQFNQNILIEKLYLTDIDNSDINNSAKLEFIAKVDKYSAINVNGEIRPFHPKADLDLKGKISHINLKTASPYSSELLGYNIKTGTLNAEFDCDIDAGQIDMKNTIVMNNIKLSPDDQEKVDKVVKSLTMPLDYAVSVLRDKDNNVKLSLPVKGDIDDPNFNINDVLNKVMAKALKKGSISLLKNMLQPYGTLITVSQYAIAGGKYITKIRLDPVQYDYGSASENDNVSEYLKTVAKLLKEKKELRLKICGFSTSGDLPGKNIEKDKDAFLSLADQRSNTIKEYFISQGIQHDRLFTCTSEIDIKEDALPRVELSI